jgi:hypothetical protein
MRLFGSKFNVLVLDRSGPESLLEKQITADEIRIFVYSRLVDLTCPAASQKQNTAAGGASHERHGLPHNRDPLQ